MRVRDQRRLAVHTTFSWQGRSIGLYPDFNYANIIRLRLKERNRGQPPMRPNNRSGPFSVSTFSRDKWDNEGKAIWSEARFTLCNDRYVRDEVLPPMKSTSSMMGGVLRSLRYARERRRAC
jgi:hypothetical protein